MSWRGLTIPLTFYLHSIVVGEGTTWAEGTVMVKNTMLTLPTASLVEITTIDENKVWVRFVFKSVSRLDYCLLYTDYNMLFENSVDIP